MTSGEDGALDQQALEGALGYLRDLDHSALDARYEVESMWRDLRLVVSPLARVFAERAKHQPTEPPEIKALRQRAIAKALDECLPIVEHYTTGAPDYLLNMEEGDEGWGVHSKGGGTNGGTGG